MHPNVIDVHEFTKKNVHVKMKFALTCHNAEFGYFLFVIFGIITFTGWYRASVFNIHLCQFFTFFFSQQKLQIREPTCESKEGFKNYSDDDNDNCFVVRLTEKRCLALIPPGTIVTDPNHRDFPTRSKQDLNLRRT